MLGGDSPPLLFERSCEAEAKGCCCAFLLKQDAAPHGPHGNAPPPSSGGDASTPTTSRSSTPDLTGTAPALCRFRRRSRMARRASARDKLCPQQEDTGPPGPARSEHDRTRLDRVESVRHGPSGSVCAGLEGRGLAMSMLRAGPSYRTTRSRITLRAGATTTRVPHKPERSSARPIGWPRRWIRPRDLRLGGKSEAASEMGTHFRAGGPAALAASCVFHWLPFES